MSVAHGYNQFRLLRSTDSWAGANRPPYHERNLWGLTNVDEGLTFQSLFSDSVAQNFFLVCKEVTRKKWFGQPLDIYIKARLRAFSKSIR